MRKIRWIALGILLVSAGFMVWAMATMRPIDVFAMKSEDAMVQAQAAILQGISSLLGIVAMVLLAAYGDAARNEERAREEAQKKVEERRKLRIYQRLMLSSVSNVLTAVQVIKARIGRVSPENLADREAQHFYFETTLYDPQIGPASDFHQLDDRSARWLVQLVTEVDAYRTVHDALHTSDLEQRRVQVMNLHHHLGTRIGQVEAAASAASAALHSAIEADGDAW